MGWAWNNRVSEGTVAFQVALVVLFIMGWGARAGPETLAFTLPISALWLALALSGRSRTIQHDSVQRLKQPALQRKGWVRLGELSMRMRPDGRVELSDRAGYRIVEVDSLEAWQARALTAAQ